MGIAAKYNSQEWMESLSLCVYVCVCVYDKAIQ